MAFPQQVDPAAPAGADSPRLGDDQLRALKQLLADLFTLPVSPSTISATIGSVSTAGKLTLTNALWTADAIGVAYGGTGLASYAIGDLLYASGSTALSKLANVATGNALLSGGVGVASAWGKIGLTTHVSGDLPYANLTQATAASKILVRGSAAGAGDWEEGSLGSGLTMTGTTLSTVVVDAATASITTAEETNSTSYVDLTTPGPTVTITVGASGKAFVTITAWFHNKSGQEAAYMDFVLSGGNTRAASDTTALINDSITTGSYRPFRASVGTLLTGLTPGSTTFTAKYKTSTTGFGSEANFLNRSISVMVL